MFYITSRFALCFLLKVMAIHNLVQLSPQFFKLIQAGLDFNPLLHTKIDWTLLSQNMLTWAEYGVNYAQVVYEQEEHFIKVGGHLKFNQGIASTYAHAKDLDFVLINKDTMSTLRGDFQFGYSDNVDQYFSSSNSEDFSLNDFYRLTSKLGIGGDIGVVYE